MRLITENEFNALPLSEARLHLLNYRDYLSKFPGIKDGSGHFNRVSKYLGRYDFCHSMKRAAYTVFRELSKKMSRKTKFEVGDVVYCEMFDQIMICIGGYDEKHTKVYYHIKFEDPVISFGDNLFKVNALLEIPYRVSFTVNNSTLTLISKADFKDEMKQAS